MDAAEPIAVFGAGSVGCFIGGTWAAAGLAVRFIGHRKIGNDLRENGLTLTDFTGWKAELRDVDYRCDSLDLGDASIILVTVKSGATADVAAEIAKHGREGATVISFQNGISNVEVLQRALGDRFNILRGMVGFNVAYLGGGRFHKGVAGKLWTERNAMTEALAMRVAGGPAALELSDDMLGLAWGKLLINLNNAVNALSGRTLLEELRRNGYRRVWAAAIHEGLKILGQAGIRPSRVGPMAPHLFVRLIELPDWLFNPIFFRLWKVDSKARSSMADDLGQGRKTEIDHLNGELVRLAETVGMKAPVSSAIVELVDRAEAGAEPWSPEALRREVLGSSRSG